LAAAMACALRRVVFRKKEIVSPIIDLQGEKLHVAMQYKIWSNHHNDSSMRLDC
jgi:hypothetical protein